MTFTPITHSDGTQYDTMIPDKVEVEDGPLIQIHFIDDDGTTFNAQIFTRQAIELVCDVSRALANQTPRD